MQAAILAGVAYFAVVLLAGFALGTLRVLAVAPRLGVTAAVLIEAPFMLAASWAACGWNVRRFHAPAALTARLTMGVPAFTLLMGAELGLSILVFGRTAEDHLRAYLTTPGAIGLGAQAAFALFPLVRLTRSRTGT